MAQNMPTLRQLRYFVTLAQTGQYRRAAERLGLSQPSLSQQIVALEDVLGLKLVERGRRGAQLTPGGREVLERAQQVLDDVEGLMEVTGQMARGGAGTLHLGSTVTIGPYFLPRFLRHLHDSLPDLRLVSRDGLPKDLLEELLAGTHDLILTQIPVAASDFITHPLYREPMHLAVARDHPLAARKQIAREDLAGQDVLSLGAKLTLHAPLTQLCHDVGAHLRHDYIGTSLDALRQMVAMNMGVTFLPALYAQSEVPKTAGDVVLIPVKGGFYRQVGLVWRKSTGKPRLIGQFAEAAEAVVRREFGSRVQPSG
ncbi:hydrogen peroxide-inducible genes activator [uncultured Shimia sp.]|uniref:hydrogen peroxide-inducible genes activator n=1 Tax=uncultured Shimia sp. TaxID=573152 RepID=UPI002622B082|nr:hydrogen peroxide-inducible genes activator [uncultured Shimia sp.]